MVAVCDPEVVIWQRRGGRCGCVCVCVYVCVGVCVGACVLGRIHFDNTPIRFASLVHRVSAVFFTCSNSQCALVSLCVCVCVCVGV